MTLRVLSAEDSKQLVTAWEKHLSATERSSGVNIVTRQMTPFFSSKWIRLKRDIHEKILFQTALHEVDVKTDVKQ